MHEWSIADGIVASVLHLAHEKNARKIKEVEVVLGELRDLEVSILKDAVVELSRGTLADGANFVFTISGASFKCTSCRASWGMEDAMRYLSSLLSEEGYVLEAGELEPPTHFIPMLIMGLQRCPRCGGMSIDVETGQELVIKRVVLEAGDN